MITADSIVYISGRMSGLPDFNIPAFLRLEAVIRRTYGCQVLNPARHPVGLTWTQYMRLDLAMLREATVLVQFADWRQSRGAVIEFDVFSMTGLPILEVCDENPLQREGLHDCRRVKEYLQRVKGVFAKGARPTVCCACWEV